MAAFFRQFGWPESATNSDEHVAFQCGGAVWASPPRRTTRPSSAELDGAGHMSMIEAQDAYLSAVREFLRRIS